jgi:hypothetical protein
MNLNRRCRLSLSLLGWILAAGASAHAAGPRREAAPPEPPALQLKDFAVQRPIAISGQNGVVRLPLPADAYAGINDPQLRDVRVFNARGDAVPFAWHAPAARAPQVADRAADALVFPVRGAARPSALRDDLEVSVVTRSDGTILAAHSRQAVAAALAASDPDEQRALQALILDLGAEGADEALRALVFTPPAQAGAGAGAEYRADLAIDVSEDLKRWDRVATAPVLWLRGEGNAALTQDRVDLDGLVRGHPRYARIQWLHGDPAPFAKVQVLRRQRIEEPAAALQETVVAPQPGPRHAPLDWVYAAPPALPVQQIGLRMPEANTVLPVTIGAYRAAGPGRAPFLDAVTQGTFYRLMQAGQERVSSLVAIRPQARPEWVVRVLRPASGASPAPPAPLDLAQAPLLVLRWQPATLVFAAQGPGPFVLALGAPAPWGARADADIAQVAPGFDPADLAKLEVAQLGAPGINAAGPSAASAPAAEAGPTPRWNRRLALWGALLLGFGVLSFMCWTLYRQTRAGSGA